nr:sodium ion-translocating decarboxylase subunit beta [Kosmotoga sp. DU53]
MLEAILKFVSSTGFAHISWQNLVMFGIAGALLYIAVAKEAEPLLLIPIAFGMILANIPNEVTGLFDPGMGLMWFIQQGLFKGFYPPLIFLGIGALTDFSFMLANPKTIFLGAAARWEFL